MTSWQTTTNPYQTVVWDMETSPPPSSPSNADAPLSSSQPEQASRSTTSPKKWTKAECHATRDVFYECFYAQGSVEECVAQRDKMFAECPLSWAKFYVGKAKTTRHVERLDSLSNRMNRELGSPLGREPDKSWRHTSWNDVTPRGMRS
jgi:hypothetical protein